jgi:FemAB-related protein (PEP-CTERM system-associated)
MLIRNFQPDDSQPWDDYVMSHPDGTIFHLTQWVRVVQESFGHPSCHLLAEEPPKNGGRPRIVGVLPLVRIKSRLFGDSLVSVPFAELGGPVADSEQIAVTLLARAGEMARELGVDYVELKNAQGLADLPTKNLYVNFSKAMDPEPEANLHAIPRKSRAVVRKAISSGLTSESGHHLLPTFYELMARSYHNLGTPIFPKNFFTKFLQVFGDKSDLLVVRSPQGQPIAGVLSFFFKDRVMPYYAGSLFEARALGPNDFMYWELMRRGCQAGYRVFDYGRSKVDTGSYSFKKHWGFEPKPLAYQYLLVGQKEMPNLSPTNPKYQRKIEMWRKMPFGLTKVLGPPLAKYLG